MAKQNTTPTEPTPTKNVPNVPKLLQLTMDEKLSFNDIISTATVTSAVLEKKISELFGSVFTDFEGCKILPIQMAGQPETLKCKLYFKPVMTKGEEGFYAVKVRGEAIPPKKGKTVLVSEVVNTINMLATSKQFELEDTAKELLAEFLIISNAKVVDRYDEEKDRIVKVRLPQNWNAFTEEITDTTIPNSRFVNPYLVVTLDLLPIIAKLYGKKDENEVKEFATRGVIPKDRYQYSVSIVKVLNPVMKSFILEIRRIDTKALNELGQSIGYGVMTGNIVMTRR